MMHWAAKYIGLPYIRGGLDFRGVDCWGLIRLVYANEQKIELPLLADFIREENRDCWKQIEKPEEMCGVAMGQIKVIHHVGLWTMEQGGRVIHAWDNKSVVADTLKHLNLQGFNLIKFYRYGAHH